MGQEVCGGEAGGDPRGTGCGSAYSLLPTTTSRPGLETFASHLRVFHIVLLLSENQFFFFCFTMSYTAMLCSRFNFLVEKMYYGCLFFL